MRLLKPKILLTLLIVSFTFNGVAKADNWLSDFGGFIVDVADGSFSMINSACNLGVRNVKDLLVRKDFLAAKQNQQTKLLFTLNLSDVVTIRNSTEGFVAQNSWGPLYLKKLAQTGDELFAYNGRLVRFRPSDQSIFTVPTPLEGLIAKKLHRLHLTEVRTSWPEKNIYPSRPDLKEFEQLFKGEYSHWEHQGNEMKFTGQATVFKSIPQYLIFEVTFGEKETQFKLGPRQVDGHWSKTGGKEYLSDLADRLQKDHSPEFFALLKSASEKTTVTLKVGEEIPLLREIAQLRDFNFQ